MDHLPEQCPLHHCKLVAGVARCRYGFPRTRLDYFGAKRGLFPWSHIYHFCGEGDGDDPLEADTLYCPLCREAERSWHETHPLPA